MLAASEHHGQVLFGGLPVPGATVTATHDGQKFVAISNELGAYSFPNLADGVWAFEVEMLCFAKIKQDITVATGAPAAEWDLRLLPFDQIKAFAAPPNPVPAAVAATAPAANPQPTGPNAKKGFQQTDVNASAELPKWGDEGNPMGPADLNHSASDVFAINGAVNNAAASPFAQSGAFGNNRNSGRPLYTGGIGVIVDNSALDARTFSLTGQDTPKPAYNHLEGIASFGGQLRLPHSSKGNRLNFFLSYQWMRDRNANTLSGRMPDLAERSGELSQPVLDPASGAPFPGGVIPQSRISPQAAALLRYDPLPNFDTGARYNYQVPVASLNDQDNVQSRFNKSLNRANQVYGSFGWQRGSASAPNLFGFTDSTGTSGLDTTVNWSHRFNPRLYGHVRYEYSRSSTRVTPFFANRENVSEEAGVTGNNQDPLNWGPPRLAFASGISGLGDAQQSFTRNQTSALSYDTFWGRRSHNFSLGADFRRQQFNLLSQQDARGSFTFTGAAAGSDFGGFLLGIPDTSSIAFGNADKYFRATVYDAYITDDWRVSPGFTLNAGVRWEYGAPITELYGRLVNLDIAPGFAAVAPVVAANPTGALTGVRYPDSLVNPDKRAWEPRIGVSWHPFAASSTVVRAGFGLYYNTSVYQTIATQMAQQAPLSKSLTVANSPSDPLTLANGFNASPSIVQNSFAIDPDFRVGYTENWQASIQRDLPGALIATATYLGIKGTRATQEFLPDTYPAGAPNPCPACRAGYAYLTSNGNSTREAAQLQLRRRLHNGVLATAQYTYSKSIDDAALGGRGQGTAVIAQNWLDLGAERGLSNFDQRHMLSVEAQYSTGIGAANGMFLSGWRGALFKEWTVTTQITAATGLPLTPVYLVATEGTGVTGSIRPNYTGAPLYAAPPGLFLNPAAYGPAALGEWGSAGRDSITGPSQFALNASLGRTFRLSDRFNADFRIDSTNALNHVAFSSWNTTISSAQFGLPTAAAAMRSLQAHLRVRF